MDRSCTHNPSRADGDGWAKGGAKGSLTVVNDDDTCGPQVSTSRFWEQQQRRRR
eukprot:COSAG02_NODE_20705_length_818_cov_1.233658_2_plen_53_part_01